MKRKIAFIIALMTVFVICGCSNDLIVQDEVKRRPSTGSSWTVMMYMCGSTLEEDYAQASNVLKSLSYDLPENVNMVVETGGSRKWNTEGVYSEYLQCFEVQKNGLRLVNQTGSVNMGNSDTLNGFLSWGMETYPADNYIAVIWNHGGGPVGGVAYDSSNGFDSLSLNEISTALSGLGEKLDIIGFDASLMSSLEVTSSLSLYADYMVASEDVIPMNGWDYRGLLDFISKNPESAAIDVGRTICDGVANTASENEKHLVSMTVSDLSKTTMLTQAFDGMADVMVTATEDLMSLKNLSNAMNELEFLGGNSKWEGYSNLIDIGELTSVVTEQIGSPAANIANTISEVVVYRNVSDYHNTTSGLSVFYPKHKDGELIDRYADVCISDNYMEFIQKTALDVSISNSLYSHEDTSAWKQYNDMAYANVLQASPDINGRYVLTSTYPEIITRAAVNFYKYNPKSKGYIYLYKDYNTVYNESMGGYVYEFNGRLPELNSTPVSMYLVSQNTFYDIYSIPVIYEGELTNIRVSKSKQADDYGEYRILGLWGGVDKNSLMSQRNYRELKTGDVIIPIYEVYGDDNDNSYVEGDTIRIGFGGAKITDKLIDDGDYIVSYTATDMYGIDYMCDTNNLISTKGKYKIMNY